MGCLIYYSLIFNCTVLRNPLHNICLSTIFIISEKYCVEIIHVHCLYKIVMNHRLITDTFLLASPPKFMSLDEIMAAADGVKNMALAHEIAVDTNFKLEKLEPPENR